MLRLLWWLNTALALTLFVAGLAAHFRYGFGRLPGPPEVEAAPILANVIAGNPFAPNAGHYPIVVVVAFVQAVAFAALGLFLFRRKSGDVMGVIASWLLISIGLGFTPTIVYLPLLSPAWHLPVTLFQAGLFVSAFLFLCLFPDGRFFPAWSRHAALAWLGYALLWPFFPQLNPHRATTVWPALAFAAVITLGIIFQVVRYRRLSGPDERRGSKWVVAGFTAANSALVGITMLSVSPMITVPIAVLTLLSLAPVLIPVTIAIAIQRRNLWDVGSLVRKTLVYGLLTSVLAGIYYAGVVALQNLLAATTGRREPIAIILTTLLIAALFQPVRDRLQRAVNRLMFGERDDPYAVLSNLGRRLQETTIPDQTLAAIAAAITQSLKLPYAAIEVETDEGEHRTLAADGQRPPQVEAWPLRYQGQVIGRLLVAPRSPGESFTGRERQLLGDIASQAGAATYAARLTTALQRSRERLVLAREEERRRIRRDLHDELGPTLASHTFKLDAAIDLLDTDPAAAGALLQRLKWQNQALVGDIRRLVYELRPPALDELGLQGALSAHFAQATTPIVRVSATPDPLPPLPAAVEAAAYRIALEAVNNVVRHAAADHCDVTLTSAHDRLALTVEDDGRGLPAGGGAGIGLRSMRERAEEVGGTFNLGASAAGGVRVTAILPLGVS